MSLLAHVPEPSVDETYQILLGLRERYEAHHKLRYTDEALDSAAKYSSQYISDRFLPDKVRQPGAPPGSASSLCAADAGSTMLPLSGLYQHRPVCIAVLAMSCILLSRLFEQGRSR